MTVYYLTRVCMAMLGVALLCSPAVLAQGIGRPTVTPIPGGVFVRWASQVDVAAIQFARELTGGSFEVMFDVPSVGFLTEFIDHRPGPTTNPEMITVLADYWIVRGMPERAIPLYEAGIRRGGLDPTRALVFQNNLAMLYSRVLGEHDSALAIVDNALLENRDNVTLLDTKGLIFLNAGRPAEAVPVLQRAVELSCQLPIYCLHLAYALFQDGRPSQARRYLDPVRDHLIEIAPRMSPENQAMFDTLQSNLPALDDQQF